MDKCILDATCGSRTIWFNKHEPHTVYCDKRREYDQRSFGKSRINTRILDVDPDIICDFTQMPFPDNTFSLVIFDPPPI